MVSNLVAKPLRMRKGRSGRVEKQVGVHCRVWRAVGSFCARVMDVGNGQSVLEENYDENFEPTEQGMRWRAFVKLQTNILARVSLLYSLPTILQTF